MTAKRPMTAKIALIPYGEPAPERRARLLESAARRTGRAIELVAAAPAPSPGASRNAAAAEASADYLFFVDEVERLESTWLEQAARQLDARADLGFVTSWLEGVPARADRPARACEADGLVARPWFVHAPTLIRRVAVREEGGYDEALDGAEEIDLLLRLVSGGRAGAAIEEPIPRRLAWSGREPNEASARRLYEKHRAVFERSFEAALVGKERVFRELADEGARLDEERAALEREHRALLGDAERLRALVARYHV